MSTLLERARRGESLADLPIRDMHGHVGAYQFAIPDLSGEGMLRVMDRLGVQCIMLSHIQCEALHARRGNEALLQVIRAFPGRILGYAIHFPTSAAEVTAEMERCVQAGFSGLKLENVNGHSYLNPAYAGAYAIANECQMPILLHTWGGINAEFAEIRQLTRRYPRAAFLLAHAGANHGERAILDLARECENVYLDLALSASPRGLVERLVAGVGAGRVTYGSDCYFISMTHQIGKVLGADIAEEDKRLILSGNAQRILERILR
jgi:uncharacterized protein